MFLSADDNLRCLQNRRRIRFSNLRSAGRESRPNEKIDLVRDEEISKRPIHDGIEPRGVVLRELPDY